MAIPSLTLQPKTHGAVRFQGEGDKLKKLFGNPELLAQLSEALDALDQQRGKERRMYIEDQKKRDEIVWNLENNPEMSQLMKDTLSKCFSDHISSERRAHLAEIVAKREPLTEEEANRVVRALDILVKEGTGKNLTEEQNEKLLDALANKSLTIYQRDVLIQALSKDELDAGESKTVIANLTRDRDEGVNEYHLQRIGLNERMRYKGSFVKHQLNRGFKSLIRLVGTGIDKLLPEEEAEATKKVEAKKTEKLEKPEKIEKPEPGDDE